MQKYFKKIGNTEKISEWKSKGLPDESVKSVATPANSLAPKLKQSGEKIYVEFNGNCLKQEKGTFSHGKVVNIYVVSYLKLTLNTFNIALGNSLFG